MNIETFFIVIFAYFYITEISYIFEDYLLNKPSFYIRLIAITCLSLLIALWWLSGTILSSLHST